MSIKAKTGQVAGSALLEALLGASVDGIIAIDTEGTVLTYNRGAERMFGYSPDQVVGQNVKMLMPAADRNRHDTYLNHYAETGQRHIIGIGREVLGRNQSGEHFPLDLAVGEAREHGLFIGILRDLRQRTRLEKMLKSERQQVRDLERTLAHVHRTSTLGEMAAGIAHEINQPLAAISTFADAGGRLAKRPQIDQQKVAYALDQIAGQARRAGQVVQRIRALASRDSEARDMLQVNDLIRDLLELAMLDAREIDAPIEVTLAEPLPPVFVDGIQIQQVLLNLIRNGLEAMVKRSQAEMGLHIDSSEPMPGVVQVSVTDHGMGVDAGQREAIFDAFHSNKPTGMGMGLSICKTIIARHDGRLWHEDVPEGGSRFLFTLPAADSSNEAKAN